MSKQMKNFLTLVGVIVIGAFFAFIYDCIVGLSDFAGRINMEAAPWVFWGLLLTVVVSFGWLAATALLRPKPMMVYADPSPEDLVRFRQALVKRLGKNRILKEADIRVSGEADLEAGLAVLRDRADQEIRSTAKRVFIGTAVSQNGRLDSLVVLFLISRLAWRISKLYNQRPHYRELVNLYANIAATSFLAGSIEEFGIEEYVHELMGPMIASSAMGAMPGAEAIAGTVTTSILSGSTNALLTMRCGIVARNYMSLELDAKGLMRRSATLEAAKMFMSISGETVTQVTRLLVKGSSGAVMKGAKKAVKTMGASVTGTAGVVGAGAKSVGRGVTNSAKYVGRGVKGSAEAVKQRMSNSTKAVKQGVKGSAKAVGEGVKGSAKSVGDGAKSITKSAEQIVDKAADGVKRSIQRVEQSAQRVTREFGPAVEKVDAAAGKAKGFLRSTAQSVGKKVRTLRDIIPGKGRKSKGKSDES
ncbi:DUF697 domain-containing protein [uncultured Pseudodesulfovibrio sp.]|uniref:DUF697 domain-containing protein n=1 Tax=uncultured Pseudodesulfovibrio sp. TaxID=2035858 RepID=UPI0029C79706|nr:DUF697 domain-containing protein [uncultured Pseudodesulfovibrio sp.]